MKRILAITLMGMAAISLGACGSAQDAASEEAAAEAGEEPAEAVEEPAAAVEEPEEAAEEPAEAVEESTEVAEDDSKDAAGIMGSGTVDLSSLRPGQTLTSTDLDILTANKGPVLSRTLTQSEFHQIIDAFMNASYVTDTAYKLAADGFVWNGGSRWDCSSMVLYLMNDYLLTYDEAYQSAKEADPSADPSSWIAAALASVGTKASAAYPDTGSAAPTLSVSQAIAWGDPVYTYQTVGQINENDPGDLQYGDLLFYGTADGSDIKISHVAVYLGQYYLDDGDTGYYQLENDAEDHENTKAGRADGVKISPFRAGDGLLHVARIM